VLSQAHELFTIATTVGEQIAQLTGRLRFLEEIPAVGDWVTVTPTDPPLITAIEPRTSCFTRMDPGGGTQVLAANIDVAFLVCGLDAFFPEPVGPVSRAGAAVGSAAGGGAE